MPGRVLVVVILTMALGVVSAGGEETCGDLGCIEAGVSESESSPEVTAEIAPEQSEDLSPDGVVDDVEQSSLQSDNDRVDTTTSNTSPSKESLTCEAPSKATLLAVCNTAKARAEADLDIAKWETLDPSLNKDAAAFALGAAPYIAGLSGICSEVSSSSSPLISQATYASSCSMIADSIAYAKNYDLSGLTIDCTNSQHPVSCYAIKAASAVGGDAFTNIFRTTAIKSLEDGAKTLDCACLTTPSAKAAPGSSP